MFPDVCRKGCAQYHTNTVPTCRQEPCCQMFVERGVPSTTQVGQVIPVLGNFFALLQSKKMTEMEKIFFHLKRKVQYSLVCLFSLCHWIEKIIVTLQKILEMAFLIDLTSQNVCLKVKTCFVCYYSNGPVQERIIAIDI